MIKRLLHPFRGPASWATQHGVLPASCMRKIAPKSWPFEPFTVYGPGWKFRWCPTNFDWVGWEIFWTGFKGWEKSTVPVVLEHVRHSRCFLDVGANCGLYTTMACMANPDIHAVAFEPVPRVNAALSNNVRENNLESRVILLNVALGDSNGTVAFHEAYDTTMGSLATEGYRGQTGKLIEVQCRTLDSIVDELQIEPDFMKIDVEGFEHAVLAGARRTLRAFRPRMVLEANPGDPVERVMEILSDHGYRFQHLTGRDPEWQSEIVPEEQFRNWLCVPN
jgi:FkbM family methyltransferase